MGNLSNITSKIISDGNKKASEVSEKAELEAKEIISKYEKEALHKREEMLNKAKDEGKTRLEIILSNTNLKVRNEKLRAKQELIDEIFKAAISKLSSFKAEDFRKFLENSLLNEDISGDEDLILREEDKSKIDDKFLASINEKLEAKGKKGKMNIVYRNIKEGFMLSKNGIDINYTFQDLIKANRDSLEKDVIDILFQS